MAGQASALAAGPVIVGAGLSAKRPRRLPMAQGRRFTGSERRPLLGAERTRRGRAGTSPSDPDLTVRCEARMGSIQQLTTTEIVDCEHDALEMAPPNHRRDAGVG